MHARSWLLALTLYLALPVLLPAQYPPVRAGIEVQFFDQSTGRPDRWSWDFEFDLVVPVTRSVSQHPRWVYAAPGTYAVRLRACAGALCSTRIRLIEVLPPTGPGVLLFRDGFETRDTSRWGRSEGAQGPAGRVWTLEETGNAEEVSPAERELWREVLDTLRRESVLLAPSGARSTEGASGVETASSVGGAFGTRNARGVQGAPSADDVFGAGGSLASENAPSAPSASCVQDAGDGLCASDAGITGNAPSGLGNLSARNAVCASGAPAPVISPGSENSSRTPRAPLSSEAP